MDGKELLTPRPSRKNESLRYAWDIIKPIRYALISTSTPEGRSSLDNASTVLEEEV